MKRAIPLFLLLLGVTAFAAEPAATQPISNTRYIGREFLVMSSDMPSAELNALVLQQVNDLAPAMLNIPGEPAWLNCAIRDKYFEYQLQLDLTNIPKARPAGKEFGDAVIAGVEQQLQKRFDESREKTLMLAARERDMSSRQLAEATEEAQKLRTKVRDVAGRADVSTQGITAAVSRLEEEKQKLELDLMGKKARRSAMEKELAEQAAKVEARADNDPVVAELKQVVKVREEKVEQVKKLVGAGNASVGEVSDAVAAAAEARAKMLERQRSAISDAGGETLQGLSREMVTMSIDLRELEARLEFVEKRLPGLRSAMDNLDALQRAEGDLKSARDEVAATSAHFREVERKMQLLEPPRVLVKASSNLPTSTRPANP